MGFVAFGDFFFFSFLTPSTLGGYNFLNSNYTWWFLVCYVCQYERFKFCLDTKNNKAFSLDLTYPKHLNDCSWVVLP
jgi:hypothetical protein